MMRRMRVSVRPDEARRSVAVAMPERFAAAYRVAYRLLGDRERADGIAREAMALASSHHGRRSARSLLISGCRYAATLALRTEPWFVAPGAPGIRPEPPQPDEQRSSGDEQEERRRLRTTVKVLTGRRRAVFVLEHLAGLPPAEVADELGLSPDAYARRSAQVYDTLLGRLTGTSSPTLADSPIPAEGPTPAESPTPAERPARAAGPTRGGPARTDSPALAESAG
jgi:DNA-directed RNA polymerase specialized sigma24 family protein